MAKFTKDELTNLKAGQWLTVNSRGEDRSILLLDIDTDTNLTDMVYISYLSMDRRVVVSHAFHISDVVGVNDILQVPAPCNQDNHTNE